MTERLVDRSLRIKVTNDCQWSCTFCHNEGTEIPRNQLKRASIFLDNKAIVLPSVENMPITAGTIARIATLREMGVDEVHLTGGEPTLHRRLPDFVRGLADYGFKVKMTTNGQARPGTIKQLAEAGLSSVTFSIISFDPEEFIASQRIKSIPWAATMIAREKANIILTKELGIDVKINIVVSGTHDYPRVDSIREFAQANGIKLVLLNCLGGGDKAQQAVFDYAERHGDFAGTTEFTNNGKGSAHFILPDGTRIDAKYLRPYHPDVVCGSCEHNGKDTCVEKFYGLRMEFRGGNLYIRLCVQKTNVDTVMPLSDFINKDIIRQLAE